MDLGKRQHQSGLFVLFFFSGAVALVYEVLWLKQLGLLFGVTAHAAATTLAVFFLGLSVGGLVWGRLSAGDARPLRTYALLEFGIAASAGLYFLLSTTYHRLYPYLFDRLSGSSSAFLLVKFLLALVMLFPAAFLIGGTLPVMGQYLVRRSQDLGRLGSALYAVNTLGAAMGALVAGTFLPAWIGFRFSYLAAMATSVLIGSIAWAWGRHVDPAPVDLSPSLTGESGPSASSARREEMSHRVLEAMSARDLLAIAFASGFLTLGLEVLWTRMFAQILQNSVYTFSIILAVFLIALSLGSYLAHRLAGSDRLSPGEVLVALLVGSGVLVALSPVVFMRLFDGLALFGAELGWLPYLFGVMGGTAAVLLVPVGVAGTILPFLLRLSENRIASPGRTIGRLASANTIGAILGSTTAGFVVLEAIGLWSAIRWSAVGYLILAVIFGRRLHSRLGRFLRGLAAALAVVLVASPFGRLPTVALDEESEERLVDVREGAAGTVAVVDRGGDLRLKLNNSYHLGGSGAAVNERIQAWLPLSLHPLPRRVFVLGLGSGITAGAVLDYPVERVVACELNPDIVRASRRFFGEWTNGLFEDPRARVIAEDGRNYLLGSSEKFDLVIGDIFLAYKAGVGSLFTREHFEAVKSSLEPDGMFVQWLTMFDLTTEEFGSIARTALEVFPQVTLWRRSVSPQHPMFALVAERDAKPIDPERLRQRLRIVDRPDRLPADVWLQNIPLAAYVGNLTALEDWLRRYPLSEDDRLPLEYTAPRTERNSKGAGTTPVLAWERLGEFCEELLARSPVERDPYLARTSPEERRQVLAGLAYYWSTTFRQLGRRAEAERALTRYRSMLGGDEPPPG